MSRINFGDFFDFGDQSEPKKAVELFDLLIQTLEKLNKEAKATSNEYGKAIDGVRKSASTLSKSLKEVSTTTEQNGKEIQQAVTEAQKLRSENDRLQKGYDQSQKVIQSLNQQIEKLKEKRKAASKATLEEREAMREANQEARLQIRLAKAQEGSVEKLRAQLGLTTIQWKKLSAEERENSEKGRELVKRKKDLTDELKRLEKQTGDTRREVGNYTDSIVEALKQTGNFAGELTGLNKGIGQGSGGIANALGGIANVIPKIGPLGLAFGAAIGPVTALAEQTAVINKQLKDTRNLTRLNGLELKSYVAQVRSTSKTFDQDYNEVLRSANTLAKTFGIDQSEALEFVNQGFIRGADLSGELLDSLREYSVQFKSAGLDAQSLVDIIAQSTEQGLFSDKGVDAVKEAAIRLRELPTSTRQALTNIGFDANKIQKDLETGSRSIKDVIADVATRLGELGPQSSKVGQAIADIFGGPGEDAGLDFLLTLKDLNKETEDYTKNLNESQKVNKAYLDSQTAIEEALVGFGSTFENTGTKIKTFFNNLVSGAIEAVNVIGQAFQDTSTLIDKFAKDVEKSSNVEVLQKQVEELQNQIDDPSFGETFKRGLAIAFGGPTGASKRVAETATKVQILNKRIAEINKEKAIEAMTKVVAALDDSVEETNPDVKKLRDLLLDIDRLAPSNTIRDLREQVNLIREAFEQTFGDGFFEVEDSFKAAFDRIDKRIREHAEVYKEAERDKLEATRQAEAQKESIIEASFELLQQAQNTGFEIFQNNLSREQQALQRRFEIELKAAGDNEEAKQRIQAQFDQKERQLRIKQARSEKSQALFNIAIDTARNAVRLFPLTVPPGILSALAIAQGALQAAAVASRPIPQFFRGKEPGEYEGLATWGEKGFEILERDNKLYKSPDQTTLINVKKQDTIFDHETSQRILERNGYMEPSITRTPMFSQDTFKIRQIHEYHNQISDPEIIKELRAIKGILVGRKTIREGADIHGIYHIIEEENRWTKIRGSYKY